MMQVYAVTDLLILYSIWQAQATRFINRSNIKSEHLGNHVWIVVVSLTEANISSYALEKDTGLAKEGEYTISVKPRLD